MRNSSTGLTFASDPLLCGAMPCATFLRDALRAMPLLYSVSLRLCVREVHGIGWELIAAILSTPQLRSFTVGTLLFSPREAPSLETRVDTIAPITIFRYEQPSFRSYLLTYPTQRDSLAFVLTHAHRSLESLLLPSEVAPVAVLSQTQWPQLRELSLRGEFRWGPVPLMTVFSGMSRLRALNLALALPRSVDRKRLILCPAGYESPLPWPDLEALTVSFPDPEDGIFARLPPSLRRLSLRCTPHHYLYQWQRDENPYCHSPILSASEMLQVMNWISTPLLDSLQFEYCADDADDDLLRCVADRFPNVQDLEIHRLLAYGDEDASMPVANVARRLATFPSLRTLRAHLQLPDPMIPPPTSTSVHDEFVNSGPHYLAGTLMDLHETATDLLRELPQRSPDLRLWLLQRQSRFASWRLFRRATGVKQDSDVDQRLELAELDPAGGQGIGVYGLD
ncbi:hypothetical protein V8D89_001718 [Ganoderma adspersum]